MSEELIALYRWIKEKTDIYHRGCQAFLEPT
jgi:hypothetical protein